jgi:hypothetical protein
LRKTLHDRFLPLKRVGQRLRLVFGRLPVVVPPNQRHDGLGANGRDDAANKTPRSSDDEAELRDVIAGGPNALVKTARNAEEVINGKCCLLNRKAGVSEPPAGHVTDALKLVAQLTGANIQHGSAQPNHLIPRRGNPCSPLLSAC